MQLAAQRVCSGSSGTGASNHSTLVIAIRFSARSIRSQAASALGIGCRAILRPYVRGGGVPSGERTDQGRVRARLRGRPGVTSRTEPSSISHSTRSGAARSTSIATANEKKLSRTGKTRVERP